MLPQLQQLAGILGNISTLIFVSGLVVLVYIFFFAENTSPEAGIFRILSPGFYLLVCGILGDPCLYGLSRVAINPFVYFSNEKKKDLDDTRYNPRFFSVYFLICGSIAWLMLQYSLEENLLYDLILGLAFLITGTSYTLIVYYKRLVTP